MERRVDLHRKGESAISSRTANLCSLGCIFVLPIQRGSSSGQLSFDLGAASRKGPRSFLGHVHWAFSLTRHRPHRGQRKVGQLIHTRYIACTSVSGSWSALEDGGTRRVQVGSLGRNSRRAILLHLGSGCRTTAAARGNDPLLILRLCFRI